MKTICLVDDDDIYKLIFRKSMQLNGLSNPVLEFNDGWEALEHFKTLEADHQLPEIIFLDIKMYIMNGWDFLTAFDRVNGRLAKKIDIYIVSNSLMQKDLDRAKDIPSVSGYLVKPVTAASLKGILAK